MIIKLIPETEAEKKEYEKKGLSEIEHNGVQEFMFFGNKIDAEGDLADFHEWHGSFRYLMGSLNYFYEMLNDNRKGQSTTSNVTVPLKLASNPEPMIKRGEISPDIKELDLSKLSADIADGAFDKDDITVEVEDEELNKDEVTEGEADIKPQGLRIVK